ncbi:MAG: hydantoinase B/oxoprolinase family protein [Candidatus Aramenus sp.]|nr:hydantoinase B/oxoprolinase family protein [Candidatus Aramenus sp.]
MRWELVHRASVYIAEEMGASLKRSAFSPNIRERMDHSCAIVDEEGRIVAQAEHIPVHLGSFKVGVQNVLSYLQREGVELEDGDMVVFNDPYISGTHLNDVGLLAPIFYQGKLVGYVVNKAHHVDVGGPMPGSLNPFARTIYEEGVVIPPTKLVKRGEVNREVISFVRENFKVPDFSIGDLNAQIASNKVGIARVRELFSKYENVKESWEASISYGREMALSRIREWRKGRFEAEDVLEWGQGFLRVRLSLEVREDGVVADFTGTDRQVEGPLNAVLGVTYSAVSFAVRSMIGEVPTNDGFYSVVKVVAEDGSLLNPKKPSAVGGGNVETSQRVADVTFLALSKALPGKVPAASSGTMMNVMLGGMWKGRFWSYYETIGGGSGARPFKDGVSAVQNNMTNTLNTPIEVAEKYYPLLFTSYSIREGSGGKGKFRGGDGIVRSFKVLERATMSLIADRFVKGPWGLEGGEPGKQGRAVVKRKDKVEEMPSKFTVTLEPGDEVVLESPGGGGFGKPCS